LGILVSPVNLAKTGRGNQLTYRHDGGKEVFVSQLSGVNHRIEASHNRRENQNIRASQRQEENHEKRAIF